LDATYREASQLRKQLRHDAENLGLHGLLDIRGVRRLRLRMGHRNVGYDLLALVNVLIAAWPNIAGSSALNRQQLAHAERTAESLLMLSATKSETRKWRVRADDERRRAFTLLFRAYDRLRRALAFIRWDEGDLAALAPALHTTKGAGRPKRTKAKVSPAAAPETFVSPRLLPSTDTPDD
jgi:hypothetical protein